MSTRPTLHDFVDDELLRAPLTFDQVVDAVLSHWQSSPPASARMDVDPARVLSRSRRELVTDATRELRQQVQSETTGAHPIRAGGGETTRQAELSLIGEDEVAADIELTRAIDRIKQVAEFELRELQAYTSALAHDHNVSRDNNPFRPETYARALWRGAHGLPMPRGVQAAFMRDAAEPLANVLRQGYAAACTRLESQGVEPAAYRTIIVNVTAPGGQPASARATQNLSDLRDSLPMPLDALPQKAAAPKVDQRLIELLSRLFDAIRDDPDLKPPTVDLLLRLQPQALRVALRDPALLEAFDHPVWRFMDALAFLIETSPAADLDRCLSHCRQLVDHLVADRSSNAARFDWALARLTQFDRHLLEQRVTAMQPQIAGLRGAIDTGSMPIDVGSLDTVPAALLPQGAQPPASPATDLQPGQRLRTYLHGSWRVLQLLVCDPDADLWVLRDIAKDKPWALRGRALERLLAEQLALPLRPRSLVQAAADRVMQAIDTGTGRPV